MLTLLLTTLLALTTSSANISICKESVRRIEGNLFVVMRSLTDYDHTYFGGRLKPALNKIEKQSGHWVDMGAGMGRALLSFYNKSKNIKLTGFGYKLAGGWGGPAGQAVRTSNGRFRYLEGWFDESRLEEIGKADVITDVFGIFSYAEFKDKMKVVELYFSLLNPGGKIFIDHNINQSLTGFSSFLKHHKNADIESSMSGAMPYTIITKLP